METRTALSIPTYDGRIRIETMFSVLNATKNLNATLIQSIGSSLLTKCFNQLWTSALNARKPHGITHFAMIHSDLGVEAGWLDKMHEIMKKTSADVVSSVIALKAAGGMTSTAEETEDEFLPRNYSLSECTNGTWTSPGLLVNTGLILCDLRGAWVDNVCFSMRDQIRISTTGERYALCASEDWDFSRQAKKYGAKLFATTEIRVDHYGHAMYPNRGTAI